MSEKLKNIKYLVTTALQESFPEEGDLILLGEWCETYENKKFIKKFNHEIINYHWNDKKKLKNDYYDLWKFYNSILGEISKSLNIVHNNKYSKKYWHVLLSPWLYTYITLMFDRWESVKKIFYSDNKVITIIPKGESNLHPSENYNELVNIVNTDVWNYLNFLRILNFKYKDKCIFQSKNIEASRLYNIKLKQINNFSTSNTFPNLIKKIIFYISNFVSKNSKIVFLGAYINIKKILFLNLKFKQLNFFFENEFTKKVENKNTDHDLRAKLKRNFNIKAKNDFEKFIFEFIFCDLPKNVVENYENIKNKVNKIKVEPKVIVSGNQHWHNQFQTHWIANKIEKNTTLVIADHGGSFPLVEKFFDFDENICDYKITFFKPIHHKHNQLPPAKIAYENFDSFKSKNSNKASFLSIILDEATRWPIRAQFNVISGQQKIVYQELKNFYDNLDNEIKKQLKIKPFPTNRGWNSKKIMEDLFGKEKIFYEKNLESIFKYTKINVCTYPETTFSEAMVSGIPTILLYLNEMHELHKATDDIVNKLRDANIIFFNPQEACKHINQIWNDPFIWWNSNEVKFARKSFFETALNIDKNWLNEWSNFFNKILKK